MYRLVASYEHGADDDKIVRHYRETHAPLAAKLPGTRSFAWGACETLDGARPAHVLVATLEWDSRDAAETAFASPEGQAAVADLENFAQAGVALEFYEVETVI